MHTAIPQKLFTRREEITNEFLALVELHLAQLMAGDVEKRWSTKDFAEQLFIASRHLTNTVKSVIGKSPCDVMEERIQDEAQKLLSGTDLPISDIAHKFGYQDTTNFIKFYKGMAGITPFQYRKSLSKS